METALQNKSIKQIVIRFTTVVLSIVVSTLMIYSIALELSEMWQTRKDMFYLRGVIYALLLVYIVRKISIKKFEVWGALAIGSAFLVFWFRYKGISTATYGVDYYWVVLYKWIIWVLFIPLVIDLFRPFSIKRLIFNSPVKAIVYAAFLYITISTDREFIIPCLCPVFAFLTTRTTGKKWVEVFDYISLSVYLSFLYIFTKSLIYYSDKFETGRFRGMFISVENMGTFCGLAFVCAAYFFIRLVYYSKRKWYMFLVPVIMMVYPAYGVILISSRVTQIGIIFLFFCALIFMHGNENKRETLKRLLIAFLIMGIMLAGLLGYSKKANEMLQSGETFSQREGYILRHVARLTNWDVEGYFEKGTILNALDGFSSARLRCWAEAVKQIEFKGHPYEVREPLKFASPHNFFIQKMIEMGWIKGILFNLFIVVAVAMGLRGCLKRNIEAIFPTVWLLYAIPALAGTIISWNSLLTYGLILFSSMLLINAHVEKDK
ncbi:MAG: hypothetical protein K5679_09005 [Lachnospiraceae bacterium]|nr:hypothetical protein [Lachnospiraceae bacterium]